MNTEDIVILRGLVLYLDLLCGLDNYLRIGIVGCKDLEYILRMQ